MYRGYIYDRDLVMQGSPYALLVFKQEFGESLPVIAHNVRMRFAETEQIDIVSLLGICWAMCKSYDDYNTPGFEQWLAEFEFPDEDIPDDLGQAIVAFDQIWTAVERELYVTDRPTPYTPPTDEDGNADPDPLADWTEWHNVLSLVQIGFSMDDIKHMPVRDFIAYTDLLAANTPTQQEEKQVIEADQSVIDSFFF